MKYLLVLLALILATPSLAQNPYEVTAQSKSSEEKSPDDHSVFVKQFPFIQMADWQRGMKFMVGPDEMNIGFDLNLQPYHGTKDYSHPMKVKDFEWKTFILDTLEEREVECPRGTCTRTYVVFDCAGTKYEYEFIGSKAEMRIANAFTDIDHLVYVDEVDAAKPLLLGKTLFILSQEWMRKPVDGGAWVTKNPEQYVPVQITKVGLGSSDGPLRIVFKPEDQDEAFIDVRLSGTNKGSGVFGQDFDKAFSFNDPKLSWKGIRKKWWNSIEHGQAKVGMSEDECLLAWGKPKDVNTTNSGDKVDEQWVYGESTYLYFTNGFLTSIQN